MVALSELTITDADGNPVAYNVTTNSLETSEGSLSALFDNDTESFYHSKWREGSLLDDGYVYLELTFERPLSEFTYSHTARNSGNSFFPYYFSFSNVGRTCIPQFIILGENVKGVLDEATGVFTVSGTGDMYSQQTLPTDLIKTVVIEEGVTSIGDYAFFDCSGLTSIEIPNSVTSIGYAAFRDCTGLTSIEIPNSVTSIGSYAFYKCSGLTSIVVDGNNTKYDSRENCNAIIETETNTLIQGCKNTVIPNSVTSIGSSAFWDCSGLTSIVIPNSVTSIRNYAFEDCTGLTSIEIPNSVTSIGRSAFNGCTGLKTIYNFSNLTFSKGSTNNGYVAYYADKVYNVPNGSKEDDFIFGKQNDVNTLLYYLGNETELTLPIDYNGENYVIGSSAFRGCSGLTSVTIGNSVTSIGSYAFRDCTGLTSVTIGNSVTSIGEDAFYGCSGLTSVTIGNSVTSIADYAFRKCTGLTSIVIPYSVTSIGNYAFNGCTGLKEVHISDIAAWSGIDFGNAYANPLCYANNLYLNGELVTELVIPDGVTSIGNRAFEDCTGLTSIEIPNSVTSIGSSAFEGCTGLTSIVIPYSVTSIGNYAFNGCSGLTSVEIPNSVTSIGYAAFRDCTGLTSIEIPNSVTSIGNYAFEDCTGLTSVEFNAENCTSMGGYSYPVFGGCTALSTVTIGENVKNIPSYAFSGCSGLTSVEIPNSVTSIGDRAFSGCSGLTSIEIPNSVTSIGEDAFWGCTGLTSIEIPNSVTSIGDYAFEYCTGLTSVEFNAENCTTMGSYDYPVFSGCTTLSTITIGENVKNIPAYAFNNCSGLTSIISLIPAESLFNINNVFYNVNKTFCTLYVPVGTKGTYASTMGWKDFVNIVEKDFTGIEEVFNEVKGENGKVKTVYDLQGRKVENPTNGVYIINGKKVVIK